MTEPIEQFLLITDLDDTLLGDAEALERFKRYRESLADRLNISLVYSSGRFPASIQQSIREYNLPEPVAIIGGVGTEVVRMPEGETVVEWHERISEGWSGEKVRELLASEDDLQPQPEHEQSRFKVSYFAREFGVERGNALIRKLADAGVRANYVYSSDRDLDFLPEGVDKGAAALYVSELLDFRPEETFVAGNSANDSSMFQYGFRGIIVSNAHDELKALAENSQNYLSPDSRADGVMEGVQTWLDRRTIDEQPAAEVPA